MKFRHRLENAVWWFLVELAPTLVLLLVVAFLAYTQGQIDAIKLIDDMEVCP
jgi:hypothetical protein